MNKYIDAEKLKTIIEERKAQQDQWINRYHDPINQGISQELTEILSIIISLQQEQPEELVLMAESFLEVLSKTPYNNKPITDAQAIVKQLLVFLNNPKLYNPDTLSQQEHPEAGLDVSGFCKPIPKNIADCIAEHFWEMLDYEEKEGTKTIKTTQQKQPEVDLENYLENYFKGWHIEEEIGLTKPDGWSCIVRDLKDIARHFWNKGYNERKEK